MLETKDFEPTIQRARRLIFRQPVTSRGGTNHPEASLVNWGQQLISLYLIFFLVRLDFANCDDLYEYRTGCIILSVGVRKEGEKERLRGEHGRRGKAG